MTIVQERLAQLPNLRLERGGHSSVEKGVCATELVAYLAGEKHSDHPKATRSRYWKIYDAVELLDRMIDPSGDRDQVAA